MLHSFLLWVYGFLFFLLVYFNYMEKVGIVFDIFIHDFNILLSFHFQLFFLALFSLPWTPLSSLLFSTFMSSFYQDSIYENFSHSELFNLWWWSPVPLIFLQMTWFILYMRKYYSMAYLYHIFFIHSSNDWCKDKLHSLDTVSLYHDKFK